MWLRFTGRACRRLKFTWWKVWVENGKNKWSQAGGGTGKVTGMHPKTNAPETMHRKRMRPETIATGILGVHPLPPLLPCNARHYSVTLYPCNTTTL